MGLGGPSPGFRHFGFFVGFVMGLRGPSPVDALCPCCLKIGALSLCFPLLLNSFAQENTARHLAFC